MRLNYMTSRASVSICQLTKVLRHSSLS